MSTTAIRLTTLKPHRYGRRRIIGEEYEVSREMDAKILIARGFVKLSSGTQNPKAQAPATVKESLTVQTPVPKPLEHAPPAVPRETRVEKEKEKKEKVSQPKKDKPTRTNKQRAKQAE
jgi:hypothetical protein